MRITVEVDVRQLHCQLGDLATRQIPFATAKTLTDTARLVQIAETKAIPQVFDRPTPFTQNAVAIKAATKRELVAEVFVKDRQAEYLALQETGGTRQPAKQALVIPGKDASLNSYGNLPKGALRRAKARPSVFVGKVHGRGGFWERTKAGGLKVLATFARSASYKPRFGFQERGARLTQASFPAAFREALERALATAKR